jgi:hypothetical protein
MSASEEGFDLALWHCQGYFLSVWVRRPMQSEN